MGDAAEFFLNGLVQNLILQERRSLEKRIQYKIAQSAQRRKRKRFSDRYTREARAEEELLRSSYAGSRGDVLAQALQDALACFNTRTRHQVMFHQVFLQSLLPFIYGDEFDANEVRIKRAYEIAEIMGMSLLLCPRRFGKSESVAMFTAASLVTLPLIAIMVYSPSRRQSDLLMIRIKERAFELKEQHGFYFDIGLKNNQENFYVLRDGTQRFVMGLPAKEDTTRGTGGNLIICEEAAAMPLQFFKRTVLPVLGRAQSALIGISTVKGSENYYSKLADLQKKDGSPQFNTVKFFMACDECIAAGVAYSCEHKYHELPHWMVADRQDDIRNIYEQLGDIEALQEETIGLAGQGTVPAFPSAVVKELFNLTRTPLLPATQFADAPRTVFVAIDPTGGGLGSDLAMVSAVYDRGTMVILGLESINAQWEREYRDKVLQHFRDIRSLPPFQNCVFVLTVENNNGIVPRNIMESVMSTIRRVVCLNKTGYDISAVTLGAHSGVRTNEQVKEAMWSAFRGALCRRQVRFFDPLITVHNAQPTRQDYDPTQGVKTTLKAQLLAYNIINKLPADPNFQQIKRTYSGKNSGKDDLAITVQLNIMWAHTFMQRPDFAQLDTLNFNSAG